MDVILPTPDGHELRAVHQAREARRVVLLCHGIASDKEALGVYTSLAPLFARRGFDSLRFDFRGHGESAVPSNEATVAGMMIDLDAALDWLGRRYDEVHLLAASFGASVALLTARHGSLDSLASICFWNPVTDYASTFTRSTMPWGRSFFPQGGLNEALRACPLAIPERTFKLGAPLVAELFSLSPGDAALPSHVPLLVLHGADDRLVNPADSAAYVRNHARANAEFVLLDGCGHGLTEKLDEAAERTLVFFNRRTACDKACPTK